MTNTEKRKLKNPKPEPEPEPTPIALVSAPWPLFNRPSIQLAALKAYLVERVPRVRVRAHHLYLDLAQQLGYETYRRLSENTWLSESVFAALLFPRHAARSGKLFQREKSRLGIGRLPDFTHLAADVRQITASILQRIPWHRYRVVGFSVCLCQLTASLYCIRRIKADFPKLTVVVGGSALPALPSRAFFDAFPEIDYAVLGEGERPLAALVTDLACGRRPAAESPAAAGWVSADCPPPTGRTGFHQVDDLDRLPLPDFSDYFHQLQALAPEKRFFPVLPAEISRGCWWHGHNAGTSPGGCAFCNLNLQWTGYRAKSPRRIAREIDQLTARHQVLSVAFTDNLLPLKRHRALMDGLARLPGDLELFGEIRPTTTASQLGAMARSGFTEVQIGIEALSTHLLAKLNKGTSAIQNLEVMKNCEELGLRNRANLIMYFPGSDDRDVAETLRALAFARPFHPLNPVAFWLGLESEVWRRPRRFGIRSTANHYRYGGLFPAELVRRLDLPIKSYRGDRQRQVERWRPVKTELLRWQRQYERMHSRGATDRTPILSYRDGGRFLIVRQRLADAPPANHRLVGRSRDIYLFCRRHRSIDAIAKRFPDLATESLRPFLRMMTAKRLMYSEQDRFLSLAVRAVGPSTVEKY